MTIVRTPADLAADGWALVSAWGMCGPSFRGGVPKGFGEWEIPQWTNAERHTPVAKELGVRLFNIMTL